MTTFLIIVALAAVIYFIVKQVQKANLKVGDNSFEQHGVKVNFKEGTITIKNYTYNVNQVTAIRTVYGSGLTTAKGVEIEVDDFKKPVHKIVVGGFGNNQQNFAQRLSVALRKAGGPSFV